jgi:enolase
MIIKEVKAESIYDSRKEKTIQVGIVTKKGKFVSSSPFGKSRGKHEAPPYYKSLRGDIRFINKLNKKKQLNKIKLEKFQDLKEVEGIVNRKIGANSLFALEASILKAMAKEEEKELWRFLSKNNINDFPMPVGNTIGGGQHTLISKKPEFQEFLFIPKTKKFSEAVLLNKKAYSLTGKILGAKKVNDEGAWITSLKNQDVLEVMKKVQGKFGKEVRLGVDVAASTFFKNNSYIYKNKKQKLSRKEQISKIAILSRGYELFYIEDPVQEEDFYGFQNLAKELKGAVVGDDLTVTSMLRIKKAYQIKAIDAVIVKPNQNGSLLNVKNICDFCKKKDIKIVISHRSGETLDTTISDLAVAWKADFIKCGTFGKEREAKLKRIIDIEKNNN